MRDADLNARLRLLGRTRGSAARDLVVAGQVLRIEGLDDELASRLDRRWGAFVRPVSSESAQRTVRVLDAGEDPWLEQQERTEAYRLERLPGGPPESVVSYHFALSPEDGEGKAWRVGLTARSDEPLERMLDNVMRYITARVAVDLGGLALHAAGVLHDGCAYLFAGPSRSGKTTAVGMCPHTRTLGDDFGVIVPDGDVWSAVAVPFDNTERVADGAAQGSYPLAGVWRLYQADENRVERPTPILAAVSLLACVAFPWANPEDTERLARHTDEFIRTGRFEHLHFRPDEAFWPLLEQPAGAMD
ncbi:MAG: hypothetical protein GY716_20045 [bacterium]|nr:hypothetical protein [bacterium]